MKRCILLVLCLLCVAGWLIACGGQERGSTQDSMESAGTSVSAATSTVTHSGEISSEGPVLPGNGEVPKGSLPFGTLPSSSGPDITLPPSPVPGAPDKEYS